GDLLKDAPGVLARDGEVARGLARVGAEAEAVLRAPHLASVEAAIAVGVHDPERRRHAGRAQEGQGQPHLRPPGDEGRGAVHLPRTPNADEAARAEAREQAVADN